MKLRRFSTLIIAVLLVLAAVGCSPSDPICESTISDAGDYQNRCGLGVSAGADSAELVMRVQLEQGKLDWTLTDPQGVVRWQGQASAGETVNLSRTFENPAPGMWDLQFQLTQAAGEYHAPWNVQ